MNQIEVRLAESKDKEEILSLLNSVFSDVQRAEFKRGDKFWKWKYEDNVFGSPILTVATINGKIVGFNNLWPWQFNYRGQVFSALQPCDSVVSKEHQKYGIFSRMRLDGLKRALDAGKDVVFNFPNQNSLPIYINLGWNFLGKPLWNVCIINPINIGISRFSKSKSKPVKIMDVYQLDIDILEKLGKNKTFDKYISSHYVENYFKWRYLEHPTLEYGMIKYEKGHKSLVAIFNLKKSGRLTEMVIVDFVGNLDSLIHLLPRIKQAAKSLKADFYAYMNVGRVNKFKLLSNGIIQLPNKNFTVLPLNVSLENHFSESKNWNMMAAMHDSI